MVLATTLRNEGSADLFSNRQLTSIVALSDLISRLMTKFRPIARDRSMQTRLSAT